MIIKVFIVAVASLFRCPYFQLVTDCHRLKCKQDNTVVNKLLLLFFICYDTLFLSNLIYIYIECTFIDIVIVFSLWSRLGKHEFFEKWLCKQKCYYEKSYVGCVSHRPVAYLNRRSYLN